MYLKGLLCLRNIFIIINVENVLLNIFVELAIIHFFSGLYDE